ncbi:MAG: hypothetical protein ACI9FZ_001376, partial [Bacteroidia bacterium]
HKQAFSVSPCLQRSEWLKVRALSALTIKNSEEPQILG